MSNPKNNCNGRKMVLTLILPFRFLNESAVPKSLSGIGSNINFILTPWMSTKVFCISFKVDCNTITMASTRKRIWLVFVMYFFVTFHLVKIFLDLLFQLIKVTCVDFFTYFWTLAFDPVFWIDMLEN